MILRRGKRTITKQTCDHVQTGAAKIAQQYLTQILMPNTEHVRKDDDDDSMTDDDEQNRQGRMTFSDLPNEIISHILSHLDSLPPSQSKALDQPGATLTSSIDQPLKQFSLVSIRFRALTLALLFRHARLDPYYLTNFLTFVEACNLTKSITTLTASLQGPCSHIHPAWWVRLLNKIPLLSLTIHAAPHVFSELIGTSVDDSHAWAFNMPYQIMTLTQSAVSANQHIDYNDLPNLLTAKRWHQLYFNEGSSLLAYSTYEYFLKRTPSLLTSLYTSRFAPADGFYAHLESFTFVAIFPFYNHVDEILKCVREMKKLKSLFLKLCPEPDSTVLNDEIQKARGHIDVNDPWNEFDTAYHLVAHSVRYLFHEGSLETLVVDDVKMKGIRDTLVHNLLLRLQSLEGFKYIHDGVWQKAVTLESQSDV